MKNINLRSFLILISGCFLLSCEQKNPDSQPVAEPMEQKTPVAQASSPSVSKSGISWFEGSVEEAFALAERGNKPMFLYWGAVWCPPCVEIKNTVFKSPQFIALTELFIPVYLDGDTERAQTWGDTFDAKVYPTMIVFNPAGEEVTRLHAGIDISAYNSVLQLSLDNMRPVRDMVEAALSDPASLSDSELQQLAYYSWYDAKDLPDEIPPSLFLQLSELASEKSPGAAARLYLQYVIALQDSEEPMRADAARMAEIIDDPALTFASWDYLIMPEQLIDGIAAEGEGLAALNAAWAIALHERRLDPRLSVKNQLYGWRPLLVFHFEGDEDKNSPLPDGVADAIRADVRFADESVAGSHSRQSVINTASNVLVLAGMTEDARALLAAEIDKSKTPYYFMGSLAYLEEQEGNEAVSLEWRRKAYEDAKGPATRIRWWASYVQALVRLAPEDSESILAAAMYVFDEGQGMEDLFSGANYRNLKRATESLRTWDEAQNSGETMLAEFERALGEACEGQAAGSVEAGTCSNLGP